MLAFDSLHFLRDLGREWRGLFVERDTNRLSLLDPIGRPDDPGISLQRRRNPACRGDLPEQKRSEGKGGGRQSLALDEGIGNRGLRGS